MGYPRDVWDISMVIYCEWMFEVVLGQKGKGLEPGSQHCRGQPWLFKQGSPRTDGTLVDSVGTEHSWTMFGTTLIVQGCPFVNVSWQYTKTIILQSMENPVMSLDCTKESFGCPEWLVLADIWWQPQTPVSTYMQLPWPSPYCHTQLAKNIVCAQGKHMEWWTNKSSPGTSLEVTRGQT